MPFFRFVFPLAVFFYFFNAETSLAQGVEGNRYRVVYAKGKPLLANKQKIRDGQTLEEKDKLLFSSREDVVILLDSRFNKIRLTPESISEINTQFLLKNLISKRLAQTQRMKNEVVRLRGSADDPNAHFQSISDTLKLDLVQDLKLSAETRADQLRLLDFFNEAIPNALSVTDGALFIVSKKPGIFNLQKVIRPGTSEIVAEIEFLDRAELSAELKYVKASQTDPQLAKQKQADYLQRIYPYLPKDQVLAWIY